MRLALSVVAIVSLATPAVPQELTDGPTTEKAQKAYRNALQNLKEQQELAAFDEFKRADKQDLALAHYQLASVLCAEGLQREKQEPLARAHDELTRALTAYPNFPDAVFLDGSVLARLHQDDAAKKQFENYVSMKPADDISAQRARRYIAQPDLARARMAPAFSFTAIDGTRITMDGLQGKVVLLDFWATWCAPCREAIPHVRNMIRKFHGEPLVVISISLDTDQQKWKEFVKENEMTWLQYCDGGFGGSIARSFSVTSIPHTFTIDADGVLQEEHIGDESMEGKIKKLLTRAHDVTPVASPSGP